MPKSLRLIFMGTPEFALPTLKSLVESEHNVVAAYSQPPRPAGRGQKERLSPVHEYALSRDIPIHTPISLKSEEAQQTFREHEADAAIVAAYGLLLPPAILEGTRMGCINVHPSLLPRWRGAAPIQRTVMAGDTETGVVIMQMDVGLDTGDMLLVRRFPIESDMDAGKLHDALALIAGPMVLETLDGLEQGRITAIKQPDDGTTYAKKITKEECRIDWKTSATEIHNKIRGLSPHPAAFFHYKGESIKILSAEISDGSGPAGSTLDAQLNIACGKGAIRPLILQRPGKKPMSTAEVLRGYPIPAGIVLE